MAVDQPTPAPSSDLVSTPAAPAKPSGSAAEQPAEQATPASAPGFGDEDMLEAEDKELRPALHLSLAEAQRQQEAQGGQGKGGQEEGKEK